MELVYIKNDRPKRKNYYKVFDCPYNEGCRCEKMDCKRCGWNPKVDEARRARREADHGDQML